MANPSSVTVNAGRTATFTAAATGSPAPTVQWQLSSDGGNTFSNISGATSTTLTVSSTTASQNGYVYHAVFTNNVGSVTTANATLTVDYAPTVGTAPSSQTVTSGQSVTFTAAATGNPTPSVQWQVSTNNGSSYSNISGRDHHHVHHLRHHRQPERHRSTAPCSPAAPAPNDRRGDPDGALRAHREHETRPAGLSPPVPP